MSNKIVLTSLYFISLQTLPTGELLISDLKWNDMGTYTCVAKNGIAKDTIQTFIYPLRNE